MEKNLNANWNKLTNQQTITIRYFRKKKWLKASGNSKDKKRKIDSEKQGLVTKSSNEHNGNKVKDYSEKRSMG